VTRTPWRAAAVMLAFRRARPRGRGGEAMARKLGRLLFSFRGRIARADFWTGVLTVGFVFVVLLTFLETTFGRRSSLVLYPFLLWSLASLAVRRLHDRGRGPAWL